MALFIIIKIYPDLRSYKYWNDKLIIIQEVILNFIIICNPKIILFNYNLLINENKT